MVTDKLAAGTITTQLGETVLVIFTGLVILVALLVKAAGLPAQEVFVCPGALVTATETTHEIVAAPSPVGGPAGTCRPEMPMLVALAAIAGLAPMH